MDNLRLLPLLFLAGHPLFSLAQTPEAPAILLEEIFVTAEKRQQNLLLTPLSVSAFNAGQLQSLNLDVLSQVAGQTPNFHVAAPNGDVLPIFSLRGASMADYNINQASAVGVYVDEIYLGANYMHGLPLFDLERVEVLRGPQGTLYGKNTTGGAINLVSRTPDYVPDGSLTLGAGNYQRRTVSAAGETPLIDDTLALRIAIDAARADGHTQNHLPGHEDLSATDRHAERLSLRYDTSEQLEVLLRYHHGFSDPEAPAIIPVMTGPGNANLLGYQRPSGFSPFDTEANKDQTTRIETDGGSLTINYQTDTLLLSSISGAYSGDYLHRGDSDGSPVELLENDWGGENDQWSQEFRLGSLQTQPFGYTAGVYFSNDVIKAHNIFRFFHELENFGSPSGFTIDQSYEQERRSQAVYGQGHYDVSDELSITLGARYTEDKISQYDVHTYQADYSGQPLVGLIPLAVTYDPAATYPRQSFNDHQWTGKLAADYQWRDSDMLYASYSRGYRSGAFNGTAAFDAAELAPVGPETVNAYEIGAKGSRWQQRLSYSAALFYNDIRGQQFINVVGFQQLLDSAERAEVLGAELELRVAASEALTLSAALGLMDSEYKEGPVLFAQGAPHDLRGNAIVNAPDANASVAIDYRLLYGYGSWLLHADADYRSEQWFSPFNNKAGYDNIGEDGYTLTNARLAFTPNDSAFTAALWIRNITDEEYKVYAINLTEGFGYDYTVYGPPREYGVEVSWQF